MKRAIVYNRVSTKEQMEHGYTLDVYHDRCREYARQHEFDIVDVVSDSISGDKLMRPGLDVVRNMVSESQVDAVVVYSPDRLTRNLAHSLFLREELQKGDVELHFYKSGRSEDTPEGRMKDNIEAVFSDYWKAKIVEGSRLGRRRKAQNGKWVGVGPVPYGFGRVGKARDVHLEINEDEAAILRQIFDMYIGADGRPMNVQGIASVLTAKGVPPPNRGIGGNKKSATIWHKGTVRRLLTRRTVIGEFEYTDIELSFPELAIIDDETFGAAQNRREKSRARAIYKRKYDYLLAGYVRCSCGMGMSADSKDKGGAISTIYVTATAPRDTHADVQSSEFEHQTQRKSSGIGCTS
jgi:site-specific DNA recombinase